MIFFNKFRIHIVALSVLLGLFGLASCQKSYVIMNHSEIRAGYISGDLRYVPYLKRIVESDNRDLAAHAMFELGNIYYKLINEKNYFINYDEYDIDSIKADLGNFFISNINTADFNLKNHIYRNLVFSPMTEVDEIYAKVVEGEITDAQLENVIQVLKLAGKRPRYFHDINFDELTNICNIGFEHNNSQVKKAATICFSDLSVSVLKSGLSNKEKQNRLDEINAGIDRIRNNASGLYEKYLVTHLNIISNVK